MVTSIHSPRYRRGRSIVVLAAAVCLISVTAPPAAAQPYDDATVLALEYEGPSGIIRVDPVLVATIDAELTLIRTQHPALTDIHVFPDWVPGSLMVGMTDAAIAELEAGTFTGFDDLFAEYPVADLYFYTLIPWVAITFVEPLHGPNLIPLFLAVDGVTNAAPNHTIGDGDDITLHELGWYTFKHGWGDCPAGCLYSHYWEIRIEGGTAIIVQEWGDDMPVITERLSWSDVKARFR